MSRSVVLSIAIFFLVCAQTTAQPQERRVARSPQGVAVDSVQHKAAYQKAKRHPAKRGRAKEKRNQKVVPDSAGHGEGNGGRYEYGFGLLRERDSKQPAKKVPD